MIYQIDIRGTLKHAEREFNFFFQDSAKIVRTKKCDGEWTIFYKYVNEYVRDPVVDKKNIDNSYRITNKQKLKAIGIPFCRRTGEKH